MPRFRQQWRSQHGDDRFIIVEHDVTPSADWDRVVEVALSNFGGLDVLVNSAGISLHGEIESTSIEDLRSVMAVNHDALSSE